MPVTALARALQFLPIKADDGSCRPTCYHRNNSCNASTKQPRPDVQSLSPLHFFNVVGVIAAESSPSSVIVANLLSMFTIPQVSQCPPLELCSVVIHCTLSVYKILIRSVRAIKRVSIVKALFLLPKPFSLLCI